MGWWTSGNGDKVLGNNGGIYIPPEHRRNLGVARVDGEGGKSSRGVETAVGITDIEAKAARPPRAEAC